MAVAKAQCHCEVCGKEFEVRVKKYNRTEADKFEEWAAKNITVCRECKFKQEKKEEHERALKFSEGLPELKGTEKQIAWAFDIRGKFADLSKLNAQSKKFVRDVFLPITSAEWWIDHRDADNAVDLFNRIRAGIYGQDEVNDLREKIINWTKGEEKEDDE